jgi:glucokinase
VLRETADLLSIWLGGIIDLLEPDVIVVGGGLGHLTASFFGYIREQLQRWSIAPRAQEIPIVSANYGAESGIAGAAALCIEPKA